MTFKLNQFITFLHLLTYRFKHSFINLKFLFKHHRHPTRSEYIRMHDMDKISDEVKEFSRILNMTIFALDVLNIDPDHSDLCSKLVRFSKNKSNSKEEFHYVITLIKSRLTPPKLFEHLVEIGDISDHKLSLLNFADTAEKLKPFLLNQDGEENEKDI